jgi:hypothetical protein
VSICVIFGFQFDVVLKAARTQKKLKAITVKFIDFANQNKIGSFKFVKSIES